MAEAHTERRDTLVALRAPSTVAAASELGIPAGTLHTWVQMLKSKDTSIDTASNKDMATLIEENRRLHKELAIAKEEKEILKKAATYFAQHQK